jgi:hypothetical protein
LKKAGQRALCLREVDCFIENAILVLPLSLDALLSADTDVATILPAKRDVGEVLAAT